MRADERLGTLADEEALNKFYLRALAARPLPPQLPQARGRRRSSAQRDTLLDLYHPLIGRVGLTHAHDLIGVDNYYLGPSSFSGRGMTVFSWAARIAEPFFGRSFPAFDGSVAGYRVFHHRTHAIVDFDDEQLLPTDAALFARRTSLVVPPPPRRLDNPLAHRVPDLSPPRPFAPDGVTAPKPAPTQVGPRQPGVSQAPLRAEAALRRALKAPRRSQLHHVLATLQADQHRLVTWHPASPLIVQGHPGSGKTIVAAHRAAWLVNAENDLDPAHRPRSVLYLGPTPQLVKHTRAVVDELAPQGEVVFRHLDEMHSRLCAELVEQPQPTPGVFWDHSADTGRAVSRVVARMRRRGALSDNLSRTNAGKAAYEELRGSARGREPLTPDAGLLDYLRQLPPWGKAVKLARFRPLIAFCCVAATPDVVRFDHVIVDEAQDVTPLDWQTLHRLNGRQGWTVVGDVNQRRSDTTYPAWKDVAADLAIDVEGEAEVEVLGRVYRSTSGILAFADRLLPKRERTVSAVQEAAERPTVIRSSSKGLLSAVMVEVERFGAERPEGTSAVITTAPAELTNVLVQSGWATERLGGAVWRRGDRRLALHTPEAARGLEFDAVVVVEPSDFPMNLGRHGLLYTSLTRANREIVVVHHKALPDALR